MFDGKRLEQWRTERGISTAQLGRMAKIKRDTIRDWERGRYHPKAESIAKLELAMKQYDAANPRKKQTSAEMMEHCKGCYYMDESVLACDYLLITKKKRPCPPGEFCTVKISKKEMTGKRKRRGVCLNNEDQLIWQMYHAGRTDREIADATGLSISSIFNWRRRKGLPSNYDHNKGKTLKGRGENNDAGTSRNCKGDGPQRPQNEQNGG